MTRSIYVMALLSLLSACTPSAPPSQPAPAGHQSDEKTAVLDAMDRYFDIQDELLSGIKKDFEKAKIEMAFPTQTIHVKK